MVARKQRLGAGKNRGMAARTFPLRYGILRPLLSVVGAGPRFSKVVVDGDTVRVGMGPSFAAEFPLSSMVDARSFRGLAGGIGVHGWRGRWLVNGSVRGIVTLDLDPPARARVLGVPVRLKTLDVSVESPDELIAALRPG